MGMETATSAYITHRIEGSVQRNPAADPEFIRRLAEREAATYEAMGSTYDSETRTWSTVTVRLVKGQSSADFGYAVDAIKATRDFTYDDVDHVWAIGHEGFTGKNAGSFLSCWKNGAYEVA